jgi:hypothetical protein
MDHEKLCACGCGGVLKVWKNNRTSPFLRGHHMRKKGFVMDDILPSVCKCGCGAIIEPLKNGHVRKYLKGHHLKGKSLDLSYRLERTKNRWKREPVLSPFLDDTIISFDKKMDRWTACVRCGDGKSKRVLHANAVYRKHHGEIPEGCVVHHKNGKHKHVNDDRPDNLMLLSGDWNLRFLPVLAKGFGVREEIVTDTYIELVGKTDNLFAAICESLIEKARKKKS